MSYIANPKDLSNIPLDNVMEIQKKGGFRLKELTMILSPWASHSPSNVKSCLS